VEPVCSVAVARSSVRSSVLPHVQALNATVFLGSPRPGSTCSRVASS
jgi:hypothetical protein